MATRQRLAALFLGPFHADDRAERVDDLSDPPAFGYEKRTPMVHAASRKQPLAGRVQIGDRPVHDG